MGIPLFKLRHLIPLVLGGLILGQTKDAPKPASPSPDAPADTSTSLAAAASDVLVSVGVSEEGLAGLGASFACAPIKPTKINGIKCRSLNRGIPMPV